MNLLFGYHVVSFSFPDVTDADRFAHLTRLVEAAEEAGVDLVTVMDHLYQIPVWGGEDEPMLEAYTTLGAIAARTSRVRLGTMVTGVTYRNPALLAKMTTTLDTISNGRAVLGIGAAWHDVEHAAYGYEFPPIRERMDRLDEALRICRLMFTEERPSFQGRHYRIESALNEPRPIQRGGPQIMVGGSGERRTLRLVARYADMSNWFGPLDELKRLNEVLERHCQAEGRDSSTILRTVMAPVVLGETEAEAAAALETISPDRRPGTTAATPEQAAEILRTYVDAGFRGFIFRNATLRTPESVGLVGQVIRLMR